MIERQTCTIIWHTNELKISHVSYKVLTKGIEIMDKEFGSVDDLLTIFRVKLHNYLCVTIY